MVVERARDVPAATSVLHELQVAVQSLAPRPAAEDGTAARVAEQIVTTASLGLDQWATTEVLLDLLLLQPSRGSSR